MNWEVKIMATYFSGTLFKRNLLRFWPISAAGFFAALLIFIFPEAIEQRNIFLADNTKDIMSYLAVYCSVVVFALSIFTAIAVSAPAVMS